MNSNNKILHSVQNQSNNIATTKDIYPENIKIDKLLAGIFCPGPHYYYVVDFYDRQIKYINPAVKEVLGLEPSSVTFDDIISHVHPEDINYVAQAEDLLLKYMYSHVRRDKITQYKCSYCFRLRTKDGSYQLFQHQSIVLTTDEEGNFARALNIHTNISTFQPSQFPFRLLPKRLEGLIFNPRRIPIFSHRIQNRTFYISF